MSLISPLRMPELAPFDPFDDPGFSLLMPWRARTSERAPQIRVDVSENDGHYKVMAEVPGVRKEDLDVQIDNNQINITVEVKKERETSENGHLLRSERRYGWIRRSLWLDAPVDQTKASARYHDGVLELTLPKKSVTATRRLEIS